MLEKPLCVCKSCLCSHRGKQKQHSRVNTNAPSVPSDGFEGSDSAAAALMSTTRRKWLTPFYFFPSNYEPSNAAKKTVADTIDKVLKFLIQIKSKTSAGLTIKLELNLGAAAKWASFSIRVLLHDQESLILNIKEEVDNHRRQVPTAAPPGLRSSKNRRLLKIIRPSSVWL